MEMWVLFLEVAVEGVKSKSHASHWGSPTKEALHLSYVHTVNSVRAHLLCGWARAK